MAEEDPSVVRRPTGITATWKGIDLYPASDPVEYARRKARVFSCLPRTLVFVPSVGLGYGLEELLAQLPAGVSVLCVEVHQEVLALAMSQGLPRDPRLLILRADSEELVARALREMGEWRFRRLVEIPLSAGYRLASDVYARMRKALEEQIRQYWRNRLTLIALGSLQVRNILSNLTLFPRAGDFAALSTSLPVVVAGAGPSLEDVLPTLRAIRADVVLVAVDTALPRLLAESLCPDVAVALEAQTANLRDFLPPPSKTLLACELSSLPSAARLFDSRVCFFSSEFAPLRLFSRMAGAHILPCPFPALGSVGVAAVNAALRLTTAEVYLAGLDFSYPRSLTHARGTPYHLSALSQATRVIPPDVPFFRAVSARRRVQTEDKTGQKIFSDTVLLSYRDGLGKVIGPAGSRVWDVSPSGLDLGAPRIAQKGLIARVRGARNRGVPLARATGAICSAETARAFIQAERDVLLRGSGLLRSAIQSGAPSPECAAFVEESDYTWVHFPDAHAEEPRDKGFLARVNAASLYYAERLGRLESLL